MLGKAIGGVLLVIGTSVGGAILALPMITVGAGFPVTLALLVFVWALMTGAAFMLMEVSLWFPPGKNMISMAEATMGLPGKVFTWVVYLLLLYSLIAAFLSGGGDMMRNIFLSMNISVSTQTAALIFLVFIIPIVAYGISAVDWVNRFLMVLKLGSLLVLVGMMVSYVNLDHLDDIQNFRSEVWATGLTPVITAFGYAIITPSLRAYYDGHPRILRTVVILGSLIPLLLYILWIFVIQGCLTAEQLTLIAKSEHPVGDLVTTLSQELGNQWITVFIHFFSSISILTTFLGISLCLRDFLIDGLDLSEDFEGQAIATGLTFLPPLLIMLFRSDAFLLALRYAGLWCILLLLILPLAMVYSGRYIRQLNTQSEEWIGKRFLSFLFLLSIGLLAYAVFHL